MDVIFVPQNNFVRTLVNAGAGVLFGGVYIIKVIIVSIFFGNILICSEKNILILMGVPGS